MNLLTKEKSSKKEKVLITRITLSSYFRLLTLFYIIIIMI